MALAININDLLNKQKIESNRIEFKKGWNPGSISSNPQPIEFSGILLVKRQKIILLYIILAQQKRRRHKIPLPHKAT